MANTETPDQETNVKTSPNGTKYCRTCGFSDCPAVNGGSCPRWPAREDTQTGARTMASTETPGMFPTLTYAELDERHSELFTEISELLTRHVAKVTEAETTWDLAARLGLLTEASTILAAAREKHETQLAIGAEMAHRADLDA